MRRETLARHARALFVETHPDASVPSLRTATSWLKGDDTPQAKAARLKALWQTGHPGARVRFYHLPVAATDEEVLAIYETFMLVDWSLEYVEEHFDFIDGTY